MRIFFLRIVAFRKKNAHFFFSASSLLAILKIDIDFDAVPVAPQPNKLGVTVIGNVSLEDVVPYIDWVSELSLLFAVMVCCSFSHVSM